MESISSSETSSCQCQNYERLAIRGFEWIDVNGLTTPDSKKKDSAFKNFKMFDEKKKWKKKDTKTFEGFGERIEKVIKANKKIEEQNIKKEKHELFLKSIEEIHSRNQVRKINKIKKVHKICEREKQVKKQTIESYFQKEADWVARTFCPFPPPISKEVKN